MEVTEVRISLYDAGRDARPGQKPNEMLKAFAQVVLDDCLAIKDIKVLEGPHGRLFLGFPSRKIEDHCLRCSERNGLKDNFCRRCGLQLDPARAESGPDGPKAFHASVVHPITLEFRRLVEEAVLDAYGEARYDADLEAGKLPAGEAPLAPLAARVRAGEAA